MLALFIVQWLVLCDDFRIFCKTVRSTNVLASTLIWEEYGFSFVCVAGVPDVSVCTDWLRSEPTAQKFVLKARRNPKSDLFC